MGPKRQTSLKRAAPKRGRSAPAARRRRAESARLAALEAQELDAIRAELEQLADRTGPPRWNADPEDVRRSVARLVLTLVEFIRQLLERQAIRRMDAGTLTAEQTEAVGLALMRLEETVREIGRQFGLEPEDLNLDLGPVGRLI